MEVFQPYGNHNGGTILFGPDQMLYIALGDGGYKDDVHGNSESLQMLLGKVLRIDVRESDEVVRYAVPADNPFVDVEDARPEIWCYGLRNVWRMSFDRETGALWAADVGQNKIEEVDVLERGGRVDDDREPTFWLESRDTETMIEMARKVRAKTHRYFLLPPGAARRHATGARRDASVRP